MKLTVAQWTVLFGLVAIVAVAAHWALSDDPKPTVDTANTFQPIQPITNWTNDPDNPAQAVTTQAQGIKAMSYGAQVFYEPTGPTTIRGDGGYEL